MMSTASEKRRGFNCKICLSLSHSWKCPPRQSETTYRIPIIAARKSGDFFKLNMRSICLFNMDILTLKEPIKISSRCKPIRYYIDEKDCWIVCERAPLKQGYFPIYRNKRLTLLHRYIYEIFNGKIPKGLLVRHEVCDNRFCINPQHLSTGTHADNSKDMVLHGRQNINGKQGRWDGDKGAKLNKDQVKEILERIQKGERTASIMRRFKTGHTTIDRIKAGITWKHIKI